MVDVAAIQDNRLRVRELKPWESGFLVSTCVMLAVIGWIGFLLCIVVFAAESDGQVTPIWLATTVVSLAIALSLTIIFISKGRELKRLRAGTVGALERLEAELPTILETAADGPTGYVSDLAYKLVSKWVKLSMPLTNLSVHPHLRSPALELRIGLAIILLHHPKAYALDENGIPAGQFVFPLVREQGPFTVSWHLEPNGHIAIYLQHQKVGGVWSNQPV